MKKSNLCGVVLDLVQRTYPRILSRCRAKWPKQRGEYTLLDIVHDTILKVMRDEGVESMSEDEFIEHFLYRVNTTIYQVTHDKKAQHKAYANYQTFEKTVTDEEA